MNIGFLDCIFEYLCSESKGGNPEITRFPPKSFIFSSRGSAPRTPHPLLGLPPRHNGYGIHEFPEFGPVTQFTTLRVLCLRDPARASDAGEEKHVAVMIDMVNKLSRGHT